MKIRDSGMPDQKIWESYFDLDLILEKLQINSNIQDLVEIGCGYGTFTFPSAKLISGKLYTFDIERDMVDIVESNSSENNIKNIIAKRRDVTGLKDNSMDYVMLFNILHHKQPLQLIDEAYRILKTGGKIGVIHWNYDAKTPAGPRMDIRPTPEKLISLFERSKFKIFQGITNLPPYHYGFLIEKI
jgi:ubiquinone/menaquinone biosynthesis C-methylase UbiE